MKSTNFNMYRSLLQAKHLVITLENDDKLKMVLSYRLQQNVVVELHMI